MRRAAGFEKIARVFWVAWAALVACASPAARERSDGTGLNAPLPPHSIFPSDSAWNIRIDDRPVDRDSARYLQAIGLGVPLHADFGTTYRGAPNGIPFVVVDGKTPKVSVTFEYADESDRVGYPIPPDPPIEGGPRGTGDRHLLLIDRDARLLYELLGVREDGGRFTAAAGAVWDLKSNVRRPAGFTSADAAGLPIFPGLVRYQDVELMRSIAHALRFTLQKTRRAYVAPASHFASRSSDPVLLPMGARLRLRRSFDRSGFSPRVQVILRALTEYGMILADNGGNLFLSGAPDARWSDEELHSLSQVHARDFEVVALEEVVADP
jgi:hypothetical protein